MFISLAKVTLGCFLYGYISDYNSTAKWEVVSWKVISCIRTYYIYCTVYWSFVIEMVWGVTGTYYVKQILFLWVFIIVCEQNILLVCDKWLDFAGE